MLVLGPSRHLAASLDPFDESLRVKEHFLPVQQWLLDHATASLPDPNNSPAFAQRLSSLVGAHVFAKDGVWGHNSTYNPDARWESWSVVPLPCRPNADAVSTLCKGDFDSKTWEKWLECDLEADEGACTLLGACHPDRNALSGLDSPEVSRADVPDLGARAVLGEGVWREPGQVGWFGTSTATFASVDAYWEWYARFWLSLPKEAEITLVECAI